MERQPGHSERAEVIDLLDIGRVPQGTVMKYWVNLVTDGVGRPVMVPVLVARGTAPGKIVGLTAVIHGNELNGIPVVQQLFQQLNPEELSGTVIGVPAVNIPSMLRKQRRFIDGKDLNHIMPGRPDGSVSEVYAYRVVNNIVSRFEYLIDLHTASLGRVNSYYVRADMHDAITARMAVLQNPQIIVHNPPADGTLRGAAANLGIPAITVEVGDPNKFQKGMIRSSLTGIHNVLSDLGITNLPVEAPDRQPVVCRNSYWIYSNKGGILQVHPQVGDMVSAGEKIATLQNIFGDTVHTYEAPEDGIVIGKNINPVSQTGTRILHLGVPGDPEGA